MEKLKGTNYAIQVKVIHLHNNENRSRVNAEAFQEPRIVSTCSSYSRLRRPI